MASGHGFRSSFKDWARHHDVDELLSEFALAHVARRRWPPTPATTCSRTVAWSCCGGPTALRDSVSWLRSFRLGVTDTLPDRH